jgi:hypothetical protein
VKNAWAWVGGIRVRLVCVGPQRGGNGSVVGGRLLLYQDDGDSQEEKQLVLRTGSQAPNFMA